MAPFDCGYAEDGRLACMPFAAAVVALPRPPTAVAVVRADGPPAHRLYPLTDDPAAAADGLRAGSMCTTSYAEYLLQTLDKNASLSSILFILVYAGLLHAM